MATAAAADVKKIVKGIALDKVNESVLDRFLTKFGLPKTGSLSGKVERLADHIRRLTPNPELNIVECDNCDGPSSAGQDTEISTDVCPFCGDGDDESIAKEKAKMESKAEAKVESKAAEAKKAPPPVTPVKAALVVREQRVMAARAAAPVGIKVLMERFVVARKAVVISYWELGRICNDIYSEKAFLEIVDDKGKPKYGTFEQFCQAEIHMTPQNAHRLMRVSVVWSPEQVEQIGTTKLDLLLKVSDDEERKALLMRAEKTPLSDLEMEILGKTDRKVAARDDDEEDERARREVAPAEPRGLTTTFAMGRVRLKAWARSSDTKRARAITDDPWAMWELPNGVCQRIVLAKTVAGELEFLIEVTKKGSASPAPKPKPAKPAKKKAAKAKPAKKKSPAK
jgi:hypothetical protein